MFFFVLFSLLGCGGKFFSFSSDSHWKFIVFIVSLQQARAIRYPPRSELIKRKERQTERKRFWTRWVFSEQIAFSPALVALSQRHRQWFCWDLTLISRSPVNRFGWPVERESWDGNLHFNGILMSELNRPLTHLRPETSPRVSCRASSVTSIRSVHCRHRPRIIIYRSHKRLSLP